MTAVDEHSEYWSKVARDYDRVVDQQLGLRTRSLVRERVSTEENLGRLVEFGCGTGFYTETLAANAVAVVATDLAPGMLALAAERVRSPHVRFQPEDCQRSSFPDESFDTAVLSLVLHFTDADATLAEMRRILKPAGRLIIANPDPGALSGVDRARCWARIIYRGIVGFRVKPPKQFGRGMLTEKELLDRLRAHGFEIVASETLRDPSRRSNVPVEYITAIKA